MANNDIDDILARLDEIKKLQTELRHLVPRVTSNSSRHAEPQDLTYDTSASIRFPSLLTFPGIPNFNSSSARNNRVQKSAAHLNLSSKLSLNDDQPSTVNIKRSAKVRSSVREIFRKEPNDVDTNASTSAANSMRTTPYFLKSSTTSRVVRHPQGAIRKGSKGIESADTPSRLIVTKPNLASKDENNNSSAGTGRAGLYRKTGGASRNTVLPKKKSSP